MSNVKDIKSKEVKITLNDGVERTLKFDLNAMAELEDKYGTVDAAFEQLDKNSIKALRFILWAGLVHEDASLTEMQVGSLIDMKLMQEVAGTLGKAFEADMPTVQQTEESNPNV